ncbi:MAG: HAMP domain-containing protein [Oscillochloris sp.]|nr:HAMP domain-containing protein [Oscillochloris sp.]
MHRSIRTRLTVAFIALAIGPLLVVGAVLAWQSFTTQHDQALALQHEIAQRVSIQVTVFFEGLENELRLSGQMQGLQTLDRARQTSVLSELLAYHNDFEELVLIDDKGQEQVHLSRTSFASELRTRSTADEFTTPRTSGKTYYSPIRFDENTGEPLMTIAIPLPDIRTGQVGGVLVSEVRIKKIWDLVSGVQDRPGQSVYIVNAQGQVIAHRNSSLVLAGTNFQAPDTDGIQPGLDGSSVVLAVDRVHLGEQEFHIVAEQTLWEAFALARTTMLIIAGLVVAALAISSALGFWTVRQLVQPIQKMATMAQAISGGDLNQQVVITQQDELGVLAKALNTMTTQLRQTLEGLEQRVADRTTDLQQALNDVETRSREQAQLLEEIQQQRETIREMSVPVLPITASSLVMPLIGAMDTERLRLLQDQALQAIERAQAKTLILDITGVPIVDSQVAQGMIGMVQAARLLGTEVLLVGVRPEVAQAIVGLGLSLPGLRTYNDLRGALSQRSMKGIA